MATESFSGDGEGEAFWGLVLGEKTFIRTIRGSPPSEASSAGKGLTSDVYLEYLPNQGER